MRIRWRNFELPSRVVVDAETKTDHYARFYVEPFERGFGHTIGNGLRRVLLSSIEGTAVTSIQVEGVLHEFSTIKGVLEDVTDLVLNVKGLLVELEQIDRAELRLSKSTAGEVKASDIEPVAGARIVNPEHVICTLTDDQPLNMTITVERGRGYVTAEEHEQDERVIGVIAIDSNFSPVTRVRYHVEETRVGKLTNYDRLVLEVWTDGTVAPYDALVEASRIYRKHLNPFVHYHEVDEALPRQDIFGSVAPAADSDLGELRDKLMMPIADLDLSVRSRHCLDSENIQTVGDLVRRSESELLKVRNFGKTSLTEIKKKLESLDLELGMDVPADLGSTADVGVG